MNGLEFRMAVSKMSDAVLCDYYVSLSSYNPRSQEEDYILRIVIFEIVSRFVNQHIED